MSRARGEAETERPRDLAATVEAAAALLRERLEARPRVMLILGSGLGALADSLAGAVRVSYADIPGFAPATVAGHEGRIVAGALEGVPCIALQGRYHAYEGHEAATLGVPVRVMAALGADTLIVTCAAGGLYTGARAGDLMLIDDHINLMWRNPLAGPVVSDDTRFPDMSTPYDPPLQRVAEEVGIGSGIPLRRGTYAAIAGPSYETPAEVRMLQRLGADAVGMSTVPEVIVARAMGVRVLGIALISNQAAGIAATPLSHEGVMEAGAEAAQRFQALVRGVIGRIGDGA